jgi:hypothetical protein
MSNAIPPILVQIAADVSQLKAGLAQAEASIKGMNSTVATADTGMQKMLGTAKTMAATLGVAFATTQIVQFGRETIMAASNMAEAASKVGVVFGENAQTVLDFGANASSSIGLSERAALAATGTYGNLFQALGVARGTATEMSTSLVALASDLASFNDTNVDDALNALRSGLSGETEPLKRFGVALNEVTLKNKAFEMGFGNIKGVMDPAIKAQVTYALVMEQTKMAQGDFARTQEGTANTMRELTAKFDEAKVAIGEALMPAFRAILAILKLLIPLLTTIGKFFKENSDALKMFAIILGTAVAGLYAYRAALIITKVTQQAFVVIQTLMTGATLASIASTNGLAASMLKLNATMYANPIGLIVVAVAALAAAFVIAWKKSETFREVIIKGVQIILNWWAFLIEGVGKLIGLFAKLPGQGWAKGIAQGAQDAADKIRITSKNLSDLKSNFKGMGNVSMTTGTAGVSGGGTTVTSSTVNSGALKAAEEAAKKQLKIQEKAAKDLKDLREKLAEIQKNFEEDVSEAHKRELKSRLEAQKQFNNRLKDLNEGYAEQQIEIEENHSKRLVEIDSDYADSVLEIKANFAEKMQQIVQDNDSAIENITANHFQKISDIQASYAEKLEAIVQKSISRLTDAFANATKTDVGKLFSDLEKSGDTSGEALVAKMKEHLTSIKKLAENASALAGAGFSQTFIEQVMAMGPDAGNKMAEALLKGSPATNQEMQDLFGELENVSNNGVTDLAKSMSAGGKLATQALMQEYAKTQRDLGEALARQNNLYQMALAEQAKKFKEALEKVNAELAKALEEADKKLKEQVSSQNEAYTKTLGNAQKSYDEAVANAAKTRDEAFASAQEQLVEDIARSEKTMLDALTKLRKAFEDKLAPVKAVVSGIGAEIAGLGGQIEALLARLRNAQNAYNNKAAQNAESILGGGTRTPASSPDDARNGNTNNLNLNINANTDATPESIANSALNAIRFGLPLGIQ